MFDYTVTTNKTIEETIDDLTASLKNVQFGVLWDFDVKETLHNKGFDDFDQSFRILEVCNPKAARDVLSMEEKVSYFLPCKVVVYESHNETRIGMPRPTALMSHLDSKDVQEFAEDIEQTMIKAIDEAV